MSLTSFSDAALPWVLLASCLATGAAVGVLVVRVDRWSRYVLNWTAGRLSGLPILTAPFGCDDCSVGAGELHRYAGCPGNVRQIERLHTNSQEEGNTRA